MQFRVKTQGRDKWMQEESLTIGKLDLERLSRSVSGRKASCHGFSRTGGCGRNRDCGRKKVRVE